MTQRLPGTSALDPALVESCRRIMRHHAKSFSRAARFLPQRFADQVAVLYAFCRIADDEVDLAPDADAARAAADAFMAEVEAPETARPVIQAFDAWSSKYPLARGAARELLTGIASDIGPVRIASEAELIRYAYRVAGTVGLLMCVVLEVDDAAAYPFAIDLGIAMQLTNIARDVAEDATRDRVYLPAELLARYGATSDSVLDQSAPATALAPAVIALLDLADGYYESAERGMHFLPAAARPAILVASRLYGAIGAVLRSRGGNPLVGRAVVHRHDRPRLVIQALRMATRHILGRGPRGHHNADLHRALTGFPGCNDGAVRSHDRELLASG